VLQVSTQPPCPARTLAAPNVQMGLWFPTRKNETPRQEVTPEDQRGGDCGGVRRFTRTHAPVSETQQDRDRRVASGAGTDQDSYHRNGRRQRDSILVADTAPTFVGWDPL